MFLGVCYITPRCFFSSLCLPVNVHCPILPSPTLGRVHTHRCTHRHRLPFLSPCCGHLSSTEMRETGPLPTVLSLRKPILLRRRDWFTSSRTTSRGLRISSGLIPDIPALFQSPLCKGVRLFLYCLPWGSGPPLAFATLTPDLDLPPPSPHQKKPTPHLMTHFLKASCSDTLILDSHIHS